MAWAMTESCKVGWLSVQQPLDRTGQTSSIAVAFGNAAPNTASTKLLLPHQFQYTS